MLNICINSHGNGFIWNPDDWYTLRVKHHIVGNLNGTRCSAAKNSKILALPSQLLPEEVTLLLENNICKLVQLKSQANHESSCSTKEKFVAYKQKINEEQVEAYCKRRENKVHNMLDMIVKNKELKFRDKVDRTQILQEELDKIEPLSEEQLLVQRFTEDPWLEREDFDMNDWSYPASRKDVLKYSVFKDLWTKNYFITNGNKFGGDYLVYKGDPTKFHAQYIVVCKHHKETFQAAEFAMYGRAGSNAKKTVVIASLHPNGQVMYQSLRWADLVL